LHGQKPLWLGFNSDWGDNILGFLDNTFGYDLGYMFSLIQVKLDGFFLVPPKLIYLLNRCHKYCEIPCLILDMLPNHGKLL
jgi:hypothetical protein